MTSMHYRTMGCVGVRALVNRVLEGVSLLSGTNCMLPPNYVNFKVTRRCNLRCIQCEQWTQERRQEMDTKEWKRIIIDLKSALGPYCARFYGGEPFCREDLMELLSFCKQHEMPTFITTNGISITPMVARELEVSGVVSVNVSLDGATEKTQDHLRGVPGTYQKVMTGIHSLKGRVSVQINTTIMQGNIDEIIALAQLAEAEKVPISFQGVSDTVYKNPQRSRVSETSLFPPDLERVDAVFTELQRLKKTNRFISNSSEHLRRLQRYYHRVPSLSKKRCEGLGRQLMIKDNGDVVLCSYSSVPVGSIGNVRERSFRDVWSSDEAKKKRSQMMQCTETACVAIRGCYRESMSEKIGKIKKCLVR